MLRKPPSQWLKTHGMPVSEGPRCTKRIEWVLHGKFLGLRAIYNRSLRAKPGIAGFTGVKIVIAASGKVKECEVVESTIGCADLLDTLVKEIKTWYFGPDSSADPTTLYFVFWLGS